jgi:lipopolysaccharide biosynthesis glycosyltransferase
MKKNLLNDTQDRFSQVLGQQNVRNAVCLCTDRRMLIPALFVACSVKVHSAQSGNLFDIIIFTQPSEVTDVHRRWMEQQDIILCDDMDMSRLRGVGKFIDRLSPATLMKLSLAEHLAGRYDKILYLDCDLTIHDDISSIFSLDTAPYALAAVPSGRILVELSDKQLRETEDHFQKLGMTKPYRFFNTGVLYIDVERWNNQKLGERALDFIRQNPDLCFLPDEHGLNAVLNGNIAQLSTIWNARPPTRWSRHKLSNYRPVIIHYAGNDKPWRRFVYNKPLFPDLTAYKLYKDFLREAPWPGWLSEQWRWKDLIANIVCETRRILINVMKGRFKEPSPQKRKAYRDAVRKFYAEERFADVEQGIVIRENGKLRLKNTVVTR